MKDYALNTALRPLLASPRPLSEPPTNVRFRKNRRSSSGPRKVKFDPFRSFHVECAPGGGQVWVL
jgi:hypothetical protein